jgi:hypothetical protein
MLYVYVDSRRPILLVFAVMILAFVAFDLIRALRRRKESRREEFRREW